MRNKFMQCMYFILSCSVLCIVVSPIFGQICKSTMALEEAWKDYTGSPKGGDCTECHNAFELNSGSAEFSISAPKTYVPWESVEITVSFENSGAFPNYGYDMTALDANNNYIGTFTPLIGTSSAKSDQYISQNFSVGSRTVTLLWNPPSTTIDDPVTLYAAGVLENGDKNGHEGDYVYTDTFTMSQLPAATPTPDRKSVV